MGYSDSREWGKEYGKVFGTESAFREEKPYEGAFLLILQMTFGKMRVFWVYKEDSEGCHF